MFGHSASCLQLWLPCHSDYSFWTLFLSSLCNHFPLTFTMVLMAFSYVMGTKESATPFSAASFLYLLLTDLYLWDLLTLVFLLLHDESPWNNLNSNCMYFAVCIFSLLYACIFLNFFKLSWCPCISHTKSAENRLLSSMTPDSVN